MQQKSLTVYDVLIALGQSQRFGRKLKLTRSPLPSYKDRLGIRTISSRSFGADRLARLYTVEHEFVEFLLEYRSTIQYQDLDGGERFEEAGSEMCSMPPMITNG